MKSRVTGMNRSGSSEAVKEASRTVRLHADHISRTHVARNAHWRLCANRQSGMVNLPSIYLRVISRLETNELQDSP